MELYLGQCLDSLIVPKEELDLLEVLVINDGSKDSSSYFAHKYEAEYPETFRVIDKENGNYGSCVNRGLLEARGKFVKVLDSDDWFDKDVLADYIDFLSDKDQDLIITDYTIRYSDIKTTEHNYPYPSGTNLLMKDLAGDAPFDKIEMHAVTYKTENLRAIGYKQTEHISYTDQEWIFWPMTTVRNIIYFNHSLYQYRMGRDGQTVDIKSFLNHFGDVIKVQKNALNTFSSHGSYGEAKPYLEARIKYRLQFLYNKNTIIVYNNQVNTLITDFDRYLKERFQDLYDYVGNQYVLDKYIPIHFVRAWRNNNKILLRLCNVAIKLVRAAKNK